MGVMRAKYIYIYKLQGFHIAANINLVLDTNWKYVIKILLKRISKKLIEWSERLIKT